MRHGSPEGEEPAAGPQPEEAGEAAANNWWFRFYGVPVNDNGEKVTYSIVSEAGSVFNSAGIAAIIAAAVLVLVGAVIVIVKKKKK